MSWYRSDESTGISGLSAFRESHKEITTVETVTLRTFCEEKNINQIDFLKIDTEGYDLMVLKGYNWDDERLRPRAIVCEFEDSKTQPLGYLWKHMADFLCDRGYAVIVSEWCPIERYGTKHRWRRFAKYPCDLLNANAWGNLVDWRDEQDFDNSWTFCQVAEAEYHLPVSAERNSLTNPSILRRVFRKLKRVLGGKAAS